MNALATKPRTCSCGYACLIGPLSWPDVVAVQDDYGIQPDGEPDVSSTASAGMIHSVYWTWADARCADTLQTPVMPLSLLLTYLREQYSGSGAATQNRLVRSVVLTGLNDANNMLRLRLCPGVRLRRS